MYRPPPNLMERIHSAQRIAAVVDVLGDEGVPASQALQGADLTRAQLKARDTRVSYRQIAIVFRNAIALSKEPGIAFRAGLRMHVIAYGMYGYALLGSPSRSAGIEFAVKYGRDVGMVADVTYLRDDDSAIYRLDSLLSFNPAADVYRFSLEFAFATAQTLNTEIYGRSFRFSCIRAAYAQPEHASFYERFFDCPVLFDQAHNELEFDATWLDHPLVSPDPTTYAMAGDMCAPLLDESNGDGGAAADIRRALLERPGRFPSIEELGEELSMHPRTLRRKLEAQQTTYRQIVAETRMALAIEYLRTTRMTTEEIAARLDYTDVANFRHAFARWTRKPPSAFRTRETA